MGCLGVHFSLSAAEVDRLREIEEDRERLDYLKESIEEDYFTNHQDDLAESDKAWDAMHRCFEGGRLTWDGGEYPLNHVVLGGEPLYFDDDYIMSLKTPEEVRDVAAALPEITEADMRKRYFAIDPHEYGMDLSDEDFNYTWEYFQGVRSLCLKAAFEGRFVLFTASQ